MRRSYIFVLIVGVMALAVIFRSQIRNVYTTALQRLRGRATVGDRIGEFGEEARDRLRPFFEGKGVPYPPEKVVLVGIKSEKVLEVYASAQSDRFRFIRAYPVLAASGTLGPKLREGDRQVPEGLYEIQSLNPNSRFHVALRLNYPNQFDREQARHDGRTNLGGDIMIHGASVSVGCLAMGDRAIEDLFVLAADTGIETVSVILTPVDFRRDKITLGDESPPWTADLYAVLKSELDNLPREN